MIKRVDHKKREELKKRKVNRNKLDKLIRALFSKNIITPQDLK